MFTCDVCGNEYDKCFTATLEGKTHMFDSFECAIHALAPRCAHCNCAVIGHGVEQSETFYSGHHIVAETEGKSSLVLLFRELRIGRKITSGFTDF